MGDAMNRTLVALSLLVAGVALALSLASFLRQGPATPEAQPSVAAPKAQESSSAVAPLEEEVELVLLKERVDRLAQQVARLEATRQAAPVAPVAGKVVASPVVEAVDLAPLSQRLGSLESKVDRLAGQMPQPVAAALAADDAAREAVAGVVQGELDKFREERRERHQAIGDQVMDDIANEFADKAGLSDEQFGQIYPALTDMRRNMRENFRAMRRGEKDFAEVKEAARAAREELDSKARSVMSDEQYQLYEKEMKERFGGRGGLMH